MFTVAALLLLPETIIAASLFLIFPLKVQLVISGIIVTYQEVFRLVDDIGEARFNIHKVEKVI